MSTSRSLQQSIEDKLTVACASPWHAWRHQLTQILTYLDELESTGATLILRPGVNCPFLSFMDSLLSSHPRGSITDAERQSPPDYSSRTLLDDERRSLVWPWSWNDGRTPSLCWRFVPLATLPTARWQDTITVTDDAVQTFLVEDMARQIAATQETEGPWRYLPASTPLTAAPVSHPVKPLHEHSFLCVVCQTAVATVLIHPCRHVAFCTQCWPRQVQRAADENGSLQCPLCRGRVSGSTLVHLI